MSELKVGFIGFGNMAQAMAEGFLRTGALKPEQVYACARNWEKLCRNTAAKPKLNHFIIFSQKGVPRTKAAGLLSTPNPCVQAP